MPALVRAAQVGDGRAFGVLVAEHEAALGRFCRRLMGEAAAGEDLAQETVLQAQLSIGRLGEPYRFGAWLFGIAGNLAKKVWRAQARRPMSLETLLSEYPQVAWDESHTVAASPEQASETAEELRLLADAIGALPPALSRVVVLHYLDGLRYDEVALVLAVPISTVKGRLFESRARLRRHLDGCGVRDGGQSMERSLRGYEKSTGGKTMAGRPSTTGKKGASEQDTGRSLGREKVAAGNYLRIEVDLAGLVSEAQRFVTQAWPRNGAAAVAGELGSARNRFVPLQVLEYMVLDGASKRADIEPFIAYCFGEWLEVGVGRGADTSSGGARVLGNVPVGQAASRG